MSMRLTTLPNGKCPVGSGLRRMCGAAGDRPAGQILMVGPVSGDAIKVASLLSARA